MMTEAREIVENLQTQIHHIFINGNMLADALENSAFEEEGRKEYMQIHQLPSLCRKQL